ncbi:FkbM family methyltransferase [Candidatus Soleaferrea massiliensis]|uniref:FkbM family methyltransferase n=1 Tax=Candidatus Soleaferrea massiliensis TaxID=1470354 RepID=UPI0006932A13|nr:FkbM family methyltransferase [Candidatus Soleaferrea massiliensis]
MLDFITEQEDLWQRLQRAEKPVVLYGMGDGADKIMKVCAAYGIPIADVFASDEYVRGHSFRGYEVLRFGDVLKKHGRCIVLLAFGSADSRLIERFEWMRRHTEFYAPDVPVIGGGLFNAAYVREHASELRSAYELMADEQSRRVFAATVNYKLSGKIDYLQQVTTPKAEVYTSLLNVDEREVFVDLGAYDGDTIEEFLQYTKGQFESILAAEPDPKNYQKLLQHIEKAGWKRVIPINLGIWSGKDTLSFQGKAGRNSALGENGGIQVPVDSIDHILQDRCPTLIKMDVEGAEYRALEGAAETIRRHHPNWMISAYHRNEDLFALPLLLHRLDQDCSIYLRHHPYIPAWETNLYAAARR